LRKTRTTRITLVFENEGTSWHSWCWFIAPNNLIVLVRLANLIYLFRQSIMEWVRR